MLAWRIFGVPRVSVFLSLARSKMATVRLPPDLPKNYLFLYLLPLRGREPHFRLGSPRQSFGFIFSFPFRCPATPRSLKCEHLCDPHSFLTVTFWLLDNFSSTGGEYHSHLLVSVSHHVTILSIKQGGIKYHFLSLWYNSTWDWTPVSRTIDKHSSQWALPYLTITWYQN